MAETITAVYVQDDEDWTITVTGLGKEMTARAPGIIAARDTADQLVEKITGEKQPVTVVHLLGGSALEFTTAYMTARLARPEPEVETPDAEEKAAEEEPEDAEDNADAVPAQPSAEDNDADQVPAAEPVAST
ncbi:hypothetical protein [Amycolatopsis suaedae]|uniref:hypothetical protein n=1 Tax=Amycolatopsis suaedae TaxID=2510978 RepID=UPI001F0D0D9E|nr:hypothetical protein [Amycolatopsis suaedae]